jgi:hypothetical protein
MDRMVFDNINRSDMNARTARVVGELPAGRCPGLPVTEEAAPTKALATAASLVRAHQRSAPDKPRLEPGSAATRKPGKNQSAQ